MILICICKMAEVASRGPMLPSSNPLQFAGGNGDGGSSETTVAIKRKTPSELRGEQLKRKRTMDLVDESLLPKLDSMQGSNGVPCELTKANLSKNPRYIETCMDDLFPSRKNSQRLRMLSGKRNVTENVTADHTDSLKDSSVSIKFAAERQPQCSSPKDSHTSARSTKDVRIAQSYSTTKKCNGSTFRSVTELSLGGQKLSDFSTDMDKTFKGLAAGVPPGISAPAKSFEGNTNLASAKFCSEFHVPGLNIPLDLTLKTSMRVVSSSSVNWFHRWMSCGTLNGIEQFNPKAVWSADQKMTCLSGHSSTSQNSSTGTLYYWVHPQCSLPTSVITALTSSVEGEGQMDFLSKRQLAWETSFRSLYLLLRKNISNIFYVCTRQFVAMFTSGNDSMESTGVCNAYLSQSTRTLRSLLKEQDILFTMPLCHTKVEQDTAEDLFELSDIERHSMGTSKRTIFVSDVDNSPESLLVFSGNINVHGLYDFLLNYRFLLTSLTSNDVPLLYSPVPFENAALSAPEVKCKEVRRVDNLPFPLKKESSTSSEPPPPYQGLDSTCYYSIEIKDAYLPPWTIKSVCDALACNGGGDFEASFLTEPMSAGLNVVLEMEKGAKHHSFSSPHPCFPKMPEIF